MQLNRENRPRDVLYRLHPVWILFYTVLLSGVLLFCVWVYREHKENQLPAGHITLKMNKQKYQPGEKITFTLTNNFPTTIYVPNYCPREPFASYKWEQKKWQPIHAQAKKGSPCYTQPRRIAVSAGSAVTYNFNDWPSLFSEAGVYRIVARIEHYNELPFQDFVVLQPKPKAPAPAKAVTPTVTPAPRPVLPSAKENEPREDDDRQNEPRQEVEYEKEDD